jgi:hypothetical protein
LKRLYSNNNHIYEAKHQFNSKQKSLNEKFEENRYVLNRKLYLKGCELLESNIDFTIIPKVMNDLIKNDLIQSWSIGGGSAFSYYTDAISTIDVDIFIVLKTKSFLINLHPIYEFLINEYRAVPVEEMLNIKGVYIQFLVAGDKLTIEATENTNIIENKIPIFKLEYLIAIMLQVGGSKYKPRLRTAKEEQKYNEDILNTILKKYNLFSKWNMI